MFFRIKSKKNIDFIYIKAKTLSAADCLQINKFVFSRKNLENRRIAINLNDVSRADNFFVEMLLSLKQICDKRNSQISLYGINPDLFCIFYLLKLDKYFEFYENENDILLRKNRYIKRHLKAV